METFFVSIFAAASRQQRSKSVTPFQFFILLPPTPVQTRVKGVDEKLFPKGYHKISIQRGGAQGCMPTPSTVIKRPYIWLTAYRVS